MTKPLVSVIIPVYNGSVCLKKCLEVLERQTYEKDLYEIIVIDNGSNENIKGVVAGFNKAIIGYEDTPGPAAARNKGISLAKGEVLAFTDADCIPAPDWIERGVARLLNSPNCGLVAGKVIPFFRNPGKPTSVELYESIIAYRQEDYIRENKAGITANIFTFKNTIDKAGNFDEKLFACEDLEWGKRVFTAGYQAVYADEVRVAHPARYSLKELGHKVAKITAGYHELEKKEIKSFKGFVDNMGKKFSSTRKDILKACYDKKLKRGIQKGRVVLVILFVRFVYILEKTRLILGGKPGR